jgi:hypothetical protein
VGERVLSREQCKALILTVLEHEPMTEEKLLAVVDWAELVLRDYLILRAISAGKVKVRVRDDGELVFAVIR